MTKHAATTCSNHVRQVTLFTLKPCSAKEIAELKADARTSCVCTQCNVLALLQNSDTVIIQYHLDRRLYYFKLIEVDSYKYLLIL